MCHRVVALGEPVAECEECSWWACRSCTDRPLEASEEGNGDGGGEGSENLMRTEAHYDGYHNVMCVLEGRKTVELWTPGERGMCRTAPAWGHHVPPADCRSLPPAKLVYEVSAGDVAFWVSLASASTGLPSLLPSPFHLRHPAPRLPDLS